MRYLIDTNVLCELAKADPNTQVLEWFYDHSLDTLLISTITVGEIAYGVEKHPDGKAKEQLHEWFESVLLEWFNGSIVDLDTKTMLVWAKLRAAGRTLPILDSQIAASALASNAVLVTRNTNDFDGIDNLTLVNPFFNGQPSDQ